ncbi:MAG TPA: glycosyltransferase family 4 protein [Syntrophorhabdaceae bacterium]|nr:glycosyltransferase family 4 protein [Syntrophorhabdaceae bacterium]
MVKSKKICFVTAIPMTVEVFLIDVIKALVERNDVTIITKTDDPAFIKRYGLDIKVLPVKIERKIAPIKDVAALWQLYRYFRGFSFDLVHSLTPKAGLLSMMAALFAHIPIRIHTFTGQVWATKKGTKRCLLKSMDRLIVLCATHVLADSPSQADFLIAEGVVKGESIMVLGNGSISGVDTERFSMDLKARYDIRESFGINKEDVVFFFLGRLNPEKGLIDLAHAFARLKEKYKGIHLIVAGPDEDDIGRRMSGICKEGLHIVGVTYEPERFMSASDVFVLPSYREGFGLSIIEAASVGIPAIGSKIYGITDAIVDGETGLLFEPGDVDSLASQMELMMMRPDLREKMGMAAKERVKREFSRKTMIDAYMTFYMDLFR